MIRLTADVIQTDTRGISDLHGLVPKSTTMAGKQWMKGKPNGHISVDTVLKVALFVLSAVGYLLAEIYTRTRAEIGENRRTIIALDQRASSAAERIANLEATCVRK